jgi:hypothetical protein
MGYSSIKSAQHYMDEKLIKKDFDATLPKNYWYEFEYVYKHNGHVNDNRMSSVTDYQFHNTDYEEEYYIKDLTGKDKELWDKVYAIKEKYRNRGGWGWAGEKVQKEMYALFIELDKRGWYYTLFEDTKDYWKKYRAYKKANVEYVEKTVKIKVD